MTALAAVIRVADVVASAATHPVGVAGIVLADAITIPDVSTNNVLVTLALGIIGWQLRKLVTGFDKQTAEMIRLRMTLTGDPPATRGIAGDVADLRDRVDTLEQQHDTLKGVVHGMFKTHRASDVLTHRDPERTP